MDLDQRLVDARWPETDQAVAAAVSLDNGEILTSIGLDTLNAAATLCAETGALCQAYTLDRRVTAIGVREQGRARRHRCAGPVWDLPDAADDGWTMRKLREVNPLTQM